jgi:selenocysteine lyase/cysteine desulfurase
MVPDELAGRLRDARVIVARRGNFLRASPHYYNNDEDINRLLESLPR